MRKNHQLSTTKDRDCRNPESLEEDLLLAERARNDIPPDCLEPGWLVGIEKEVCKQQDSFEKNFNNQYPYFAKYSSKDFPHGGVFKAYPLADNRCCFEFKKYAFGEDKQRYEDLYFTYIIDGKSKYDEQLSFKHVLDRIQKNIDNRKYIAGAGFSDFEAQSLQDDISYLGDRASPAFRKRHTDRMDRLVIAALRSMPAFFQSQKPGIVLLKKHFEKRYTQMFHGTLKEKKDAARFIEIIYKNRGASKQGIIPDCLYVSGLVHFLLPIARNMHKKYNKAFPEITISKDNPDWKQKLKKKVLSVDHRLIPLVENKTLSYLLDNPRNFIEQTLLKDFFNVKYEVIKKRLKDERNGKIRSSLLHPPTSSL